MQTIAYTYTSDHHVESITRAFQSPDARTITYAYSPSGKMTSKTFPSGIVLTYCYHPLGYMSSLTSSDGVINHLFEYDRLGRLIEAIDENQRLTIQRQIDSFGNVIQEAFSFGIKVQKKYDAFNRLTSLKMGEQGEVLYHYDPLYLRKVTRLSPHEETLYTHTYETYDEDGNLLLEDLIDNLGQVMHTTDPRRQKVCLSSPYFSQECMYNPVGNLISNKTDGMLERYTYDDFSQLSSEKNHSLIYSYDSLYNRIEKNSAKYEINPLNELLSFAHTHCAYDLDGNQILKKTPEETLHFTYDPLHRLIEAVSEKKKVHFIYDPLGRRLSKTVHAYLPIGWKESQEYYLYHDQNEIGAFTANNIPKNLRIFGLSTYKDNPTTIAIEIEDRIFAPLLDVQNNIRRLIDTKTKNIESCHDFTAFGEESHISSNVDVTNPWRFASKRLDAELGLIYFGKRYYDPHFGRWLTTDPAGFIDSVNLYQYVLNNPFRYIDPDGQFAFLIALPILAWGYGAAGVALSTLTITQAATLALTATVAWGAYELDRQSRRLDRMIDSKYYSDGHVYGDSSYRTHRKKKGEIDENLPIDPLNDPNLEDISHPLAKDQGHYKFKDKKTGEIIEYDKGKPGASGHKGHDHYHRPNPQGTGRKDAYLDSKGNPVPDGSDASHLYPPDWIVWKNLI